jgi:phage-related protein
MNWKVETLNKTVDEEILSLPADMQARFFRIADLIESQGLQSVGMPHVRPLRDKLWEIRMKGRDGIARALYVAATGKRVIVVRAFVKKTQTTPKSEIELALKRAQEVLK